MNTIHGMMRFGKAFFLLLTAGLFPVAAAAQAPTGTNYDNCHFWNLSKGDVYLLPDKTKGYMWQNGKWEYTSNGGSSSTVVQYILMDPDNKFNGNPSSLANYQKAVTTTSGGTVDIVNRTDVTNVISAWAAKANSYSPKRPQTSNRIVVSCNQKYTILLDNVWSTYQLPDNNRKTGGIGFYPQSDGAVFYVYLKGDNRFGNVYYNSAWQDMTSYGYTKDAPSDIEFTTAQVVFRSAAAANSAQGTLTVANITSGNANHYNSVIGASDHEEKYENTRGVTIEGGTIFAGAEPADECTAIGAGGNGIGKVTVSGGVVTAVTSSTGTALGGGIGWTAAGGPGEIAISGGTVYAYNLGIAKNGVYVPAAAIGGASSSASAGASATVTITGGTVYAQSVGGVAIGGGGSTSNSGGDATIIIRGGNITAKSVSGTQGGVSIPFGTAIGGGLGGGNVGGNCTFTMSSGTLQAGSVGGGNGSTRVGSANVTITGGDIRAQFIMAGGGSSASRFTMSGGTIHNSSTGSTDFRLLKTDGGALWQGDASGIVNITGGTIDNCEAANGGAIYTTGGTVSVSNANITNCRALTGDGGAFYLSPGATISMTSGSIRGNSARNGGGIYLASGAALTYTTSSSSTGYIRNNTASSLGGGVYLAQGTSSKKTQLSFTLNSPNLGFYDNTAAVGADDIYAYGEGTTRVAIPNVSSMNLGGYSVAGATLEWYEDYRESDSRYSLGTQQGDATAIRRYRAARDAFLPVWKLPSSSLSTFYEKYLCLTLGFEFASMEIRRSGLLPRQSAVFKVEFQGESLGRPTQYVTVLGTAEEEKLQDGGVRWNYARIGYLPKGSYKVTEIPWTWYKSDKTVSATEKTQDISTEAGRIYEFTNGTAAVATLPRHDEERKENELVP